MLIEVGRVCYTTGISVGSYELNSTLALRYGNIPAYKVELAPLNIHEVLFSSRPGEPDIPTRKRRTLGRRLCGRRPFQRSNYEETKMYAMVVFIRTDMYSNRMFRLCHQTDNHNHH